jgi:hypothetical protein
MKVSLTLAVLGMACGFCVSHAPVESTSALAAEAIVFMSSGAAKPIVAATPRDRLPAELTGDSSADFERAWPEWVVGHDTAIRARVWRGDEDSLVNLLLLGTTFTTRPRATVRSLAAPAGAPEFAAVLRGRLEDMAAAIESPPSNERLEFARQLVERSGINPADRNRVRSYLLAITRRMVQESDGYERAIQSRDAGAPARESTLYQQRGISSDTALFPGFAIEQTLSALKSARPIGAAAIRRVGVVGPGLDFVDKDYGYDFYPPQTIQPFAVADSLFRLGLATPDDLAIVTFDLSPRINQHLESARRRARRGEGYVMQVPLDRDIAWTPGLVAYWQRLGGTIGDPATALRPPPAAGRVKVRAVRVRPAIVMSIVPRDINIVVQHLDRTAFEPQFDVMVATNVLVYYDAFEQALALGNIARMLTPGGVLLANHLLPDVESIALRPVGHTSVSYVDGPHGGDRVIWYQRQ